MKIRYFLAAAFIILLVSARAVSSQTAGIKPASVEVKLHVPEKYRKGPFKTERTLMAPPGFRVSVFAAGLKGPRFMAFDKNGVLFVSLTQEGRIVALPGTEGNGEFVREAVFASGLDRPHGLIFRDDGLVVAETGRLILLSDSRGGLEADTKKVITDDMPMGGGHFTRTVVEGPDGAMYVSAGSSCNVCVEKDGRRAAVLRFSGGRAAVFAKGLRNSVGLAFHPATKELWGVDNGRDLLGDDIPPDELNRIVGGGDYGWPYCYGKKIADPEFGSKERCEGTVPSSVDIQAHSAPLGIAFGYGLKFPEAYRDALYAAYHGSWNRTVPTGYKLVAIPFKDGSPSGGPVDIITGWLKDGVAWGRPVDPVVGKDGALYLSDDYAGAIYRITAE